MRFMRFSAAQEDIASLVASSLFDGGAGGGNGSEAAAELRDLVITIQDLTVERDEARAAAEKLKAAAAEGGDPEELTRLRKENAELRGENDNMFTLKEENEHLRTEIEKLRLQLDCMRDVAGDAEPVLG